MDYLYLIIFALLPSLIWLLIFLRSDANPESNEMILKVFLYGMVAVIPAAIIQFGFIGFFKSLPISPFFILILSQLIGVGVVEEVSKFLVVHLMVLKSSELDEPLDVMLYMIIAALGFAALENIMYLLQAETISGILWTNLLRFIAPVFGHALWSGTIGYFLATSIYEPKQRLGLLTIGFSLAIFLHAAFNYVIMRSADTGDPRWLILIIIMIISLAVFVTLGFKRLQKLKSICKIHPVK